jgi:oligopeptidase B
MKQRITTPTAAKKPHSYEINGNIINDDYSWLRDPDWPNVKDQEIIDYLTKENQYANQHLEQLSDLKEQIFQELKGRITLKDKTVPVRYKDYLYYNRIEENSEYAVYCRNRVGSEKEEIILDIPSLAEGKKFFSVGAVAVAEDQVHVAYSFDESGSERYKINVKNLETHELLADEIEGIYGSIIWHKKAFGFFYTPTDENWRHLKVYFHKVGDDVRNDKLVYEEKDQLYSVSIGKTNSGEFLLINIAGHGCNEVRFIDLSDEIFNVKLIRERTDKVFYYPEHRKDCFYIRSNYQDESHFVIAKALLETPHIWEIFISEDVDCYIESFDITSRFMLLNKRRNSMPILEIIDLNNMDIRNPSFDLEAYEAGIYTSNFEDDDIRINCSSFVEPDATYAYDYSQNKMSLLKKKLIPSGFNAHEYVVERIFVENNGVQVPCTIFYRKDKFKKDGSNILYLYGYGSYAHRVPVNFRVSILSLVDRGMIYGIAHIRGGDDLGFDWYESAKFLNKKRTFEDYVAICDYLIKEKYTKTGNIIASGGSAGGMLVGAVLNMRPDLFRMGVMHVPFVDVINTMLDETLPLTPGEFKEWGNPKNPEYFDYIKSYSPYDNIEAKIYPAMFVTAGISDPRVGYWEPAKWVAKLRDIKLDNNPIIFKTNMEQGHKGASGRFAYLYEIAEEYSFIVDFRKFTSNSA